MVDQDKRKIDRKINIVHYWDISMNSQLNYTTGYSLNQLTLWALFVMFMLYAPQRSGGQYVVYGVKNS